MQIPALEPVPLVRTALGYYCHPTFDLYWTKKFGQAEGCSAEEWQELKTYFGIEVCTVDMEHDLDESSQVYKDFFEKGGCDVSGWTPSTPNGDGWFLLSINDTEDGPIAMWARKMVGENGNNKS